jgi:flagellar basal body-associated protein FliL
MALGGILKTLGVVVVAAGLGVGGTIGAQMFMPHHADTSLPAKPPPPAPPKPVLFADVSDITVSIPPDTGQPATSYLQFAVQFSTTDPNALVVFAQLQPIIKADIINLLMNETSKGLQDPQTRADLMKSCLDISNEVLSQKANYTPATPFSSAYITNLVVQD